jgi:hypothetical protein
MTLDLRKFFTREAIVRSLESLPELASPVLDLLYPLSQRINHPFPVIGYEDLGLPQGNIPVVRRGAHSYALKPQGGSIPIIEPQPVNPSVFVDAAKLNNLAMLNPQGQQQFINNQIDTLRKACRATAEALAAQSILGAISYPMATEGAGFLNYEVTYGTPESVTVAKKWDASGAKLSDITKGFAQAVAKLRQAGFGSRVEFWVPSDPFNVLLDIVGALTNQGLAGMAPGVLTIGGGYTVRLMPASYTDLETGEAAGGIGAKQMVAVDLNGGQKLFYAALDDLDANLQALPFFAKPIPSDDPSGYKIVGASKPLPVPNVRATVTATVLT